MQKNVSGIWLLDKPVGITSRKFLDQVNQKIKIKKIGHSGTLDPLASGLMILLGGKARKIQDLFTKLDKCYVVDIFLGANSETDDAEGPIVVRPEAKFVPEEKLKKALDYFCGEISQTPPIYSAVKIKGERAYKSARKGKNVSISPRKIKIYSNKILEYNYPLLSLQVKCSSGTYIRSLARDIGEYLSVGGYVKELRRISVGPFDISQANNLENVAIKTMIPLEEALEKYPKIELSEDHWFSIRNGQKIPWELEDTEEIFIWISGKVTAKGQVIDGLLCPKKMLTSENDFCRS